MAHHGRAGKNQIPAGNATKGPAKTKAGPAKRARGRTAQTNNPDANAGPEAREGNVLQERLTEVNNPIGNGGGKMRGDRQNMTPDPGMRGNATATKRGNRRNIGLRNDRNPSSTAGRRNNRVPNEGG